MEVLSFFAYDKKVDTPEFFIVLFITRKNSTVIVVIEGGSIRPLQISILKLLTFDNLFPPNDDGYHLFPPK